MSRGYSLNWLTLVLQYHGHAIILEFSGHYDIKHTLQIRLNITHLAERADVDLAGNPFFALMAKKAFRLKQI